VRSKITDSPGGRPDRLFVPPNMASAISAAVFNGQHGDACGMLRDLWTPFGLEGPPRLIIVLAKHRSDADHWVVHRSVFCYLVVATHLFLISRFSLSEGTLTTYDTYPERTLPDGRVSRSRFEFRRHTHSHFTSASWLVVCHPCCVAICSAPEP
jgi:hypothetical protein